jgi:hypothetical protein
VGGDPDKGLPDGWEMLDAKTGAPSGIGKGWAYAPGATVSHTVQVLAEKAVDWPSQIASGFMAELPESVIDQFGAAYRALTSVADDLGRFAANVEAGFSGAAFRPLGPVQSQWSQVLQEIAPDQMQFTLTRGGMNALLGQGHTREQVSQLGQALNDIRELQVRGNAIEVTHGGGILDLVPDLDQRMLNIVGWRTS